MHNYDAIFMNLDLLSDADGARSRPSQNLATSLTWSLAGQVSGLMADLVLIDHPDNPRRARSPEAAADRTRKVEQAIDERLVLLSQFAVRANPELLPDPSQFIAPSTRESGSQVDSDELAELTGLSVKEISGYVEDERETQRQIRALQDEARIRQGKAIIHALADALHNVRVPDEDISPLLAYRLLDKMAEKLDTTIGRTIGHIARTLRPRARAELGGQVQVMRDILHRVDQALGDMEQRMEQRAEPGYPDRRSTDERIVYEQAA